MINEQIDAAHKEEQMMWVATAMVARYILTGKVAEKEDVEQLLDDTLRDPAMGQMFARLLVFMPTIGLVTLAGEMARADGDPSRLDGDAVRLLATLKARLSDASVNGALEPKVGPVDSSLN